MTLLRRVLLPIASDADARATCAALRPHLDGVEQVVAVHVIEKGGGTVDKAPLEKRQSDAQAFLAVVAEELGDDVPTETRIAYGTDIVETVFDVADEVDATAIAFRPRGGSRIVRLITGDTATRIVTNSEIPAVSLPDPEAIDG